MPQCVDRFKAAFPEEADPAGLDNMAKAIGALDATPITPLPFDAG